MRLHLLCLPLLLCLPAASAVSVSPLNAAELAALLGDFRAVSITAPAGSMQATVQVTSQLNGELSAELRGQPSLFYRETRTYYAYDFKTPLRVLVGLAGDPSRRQGTAPAPGLPGFQPCEPDQQTAIVGVSTASETRVGRQCLGMGVRTGTQAGIQGVLSQATFKLNVWTPIYTWSFVKGSDTTDAAVDEASRNPAAQMVWWVYFSSKSGVSLPPVPLYTPKR